MSYSGDTGNTHLVSLTAVEPHRLRIELGDWSNPTQYRYAEYAVFNVSGINYMLAVGNYSGDAGMSS